LVEKIKTDSPKGNIRLIVIFLSIGLFGMLFLSLLGWFSVIPFLWVGILTLVLLGLEIGVLIKILSNPSWK